MAPNATDPLASPSLSRYIASSLPKNEIPQLKTPTDAVAIACHAGMLAVGFKLVGLGEDHRIEAQSEQDNAQPLPSEWNTSGSHAFRYTHSHSSMQHLLKVSRLGSKTIIYGLGMGDDRTNTFDITTKDFISESSLPASPTATTDADSADASHAIQTIFISPSRLTDLGALLRLNIIQKLMPSLQKEGYEETRTGPTSTSTSTSQSQPRNPPPNPHAPYQPPAYDPLRDDPMMPRPAQPHPLMDPSVGPRRPPVPPGDFPPPGFEDEYELNGPARRWPGAAGGMAPSFPSIGDRDLYPQGLGPRDPLRVGGGGLARPDFGGGMHPTLPGQGGESGMFDPRAPPGARYDPTGPGDGPRRGAGFGSGFGGGPPNPFGGYGSGDFI